MELTSIMVRNVASHIQSIMDVSPHPDCQNKGQRKRSETSQVYRSQVVQVSVVEPVHDQVLPPGAGR